jgi:hypothetical protein
MSMKKRKKGTIKKIGAYFNLSASGKKEKRAPLKR